MLRIFGLSVLVFLIPSLALAQTQDALKEREIADRIKKLDLDLAQTIRPWIAEHCLACHEGDSAEAGLDLAKTFGVAQVVGSSDQWRRLWQRVEAGEMPPPDHAVLTDKEQQVFGGWLRSVLFDIACQTTLPRRSPSVRRLTRAEYQMAVEDFTGVHYSTSEQFPADEVGHGFDNISDLLTVSPLLMEKYLSAAEAIAAEAIIDPAEHRLERSISGIDLTGAEGVYPAEQDQVLASGGELGTELAVPSAGKYQIEVVAWGQQAGDELCRMGLVVDGRQVDECEVPSTRRKPSKHSFTVELAAGAHKFAVSFNNDFYNPEHPDEDQRDRNLGIRRFAISGPEGVTPPGGPRQAELIFLRPDARTRPTAAARKVLEQWATIAFRRDPEQAEVLRLVKLFDEQIRWGASYDAALQTCLVAVLTSPSFLFKRESVPPAGEVARISQRELASALSFLIWSRAADEQLVELAKGGRLNEPAVLAGEVDRLLQEPRATAWLDNFVEQWLYLRILDRLEPQPELGPELLGWMREETKTFVAELVRENRPIRELVAADFSFVNAPLANWYGLEGDFDSDKLTRVSLTSSARRGLLGQASILRLTSNPDRTSPVKRGKWILETLLNQPPPPPAPDIPQLDSQPQLTGTLRQKMEQHRSDPNCASCHLKMDALGFALERFDELGRWRDLQAGQPIDDRGELPGGIEVAGASRLAEILGNQYERQIARGFVEKLLTFALGRGLSLHDDASVVRILEQTESQGFRMRDLIQATAASDAFQMRSGGPPATKED